MSERSQKLMREYIQLGQVHLPPFESNLASVDSKFIIAWLNDEMPQPRTGRPKVMQSLACLTAQLRANLLADLRKSLLGMDLEREDAKKPLRGKKIAKYTLLGVAGSLVVACEGFDSITAMMGMFSAPSLVTFAIGIGFSVFSVAVLYGLELYQISKHLGVKIKEASRMLEACTVQLDEIKSIRRKIASLNLTRLSTAELVEREKILNMLSKRFKDLSETSRRFMKALRSKGVKAVKYLVTGLAGFLFFGSGFFAGQSVAVFVLNLFMGAVAPTFWPVILFSIVVGLASFSLFWFVQNVGVSQLISKWFRLDKEKVERLCDKEKGAQEENKLKVLSENIRGVVELKSAAEGRPVVGGNDGFNRDRSIKDFERKASAYSSVSLGNNSFFTSNAPTVHPAAKSTVESNHADCQYNTAPI